MSLKTQEIKMLKIGNKEIMIRNGDMLKGDWDILSDLRGCNYCNQQSWIGVIC